MKARISLKAVAVVALALADAPPAPTAVWAFDPLPPPFCDIEKIRAAEAKRARRAAKLRANAKPR